MLLVPVVFLAAVSHGSAFHLVRSRPYIIVSGKQNTAQPLANRMYGARVPLLTATEPKFLFDAEVESNSAVSRWLTNTIGVTPSKPAQILIVCASIVALLYPPPVKDVAFAVAFPAYLIAANVIRFRCNAKAGERTSGTPLVPLLRHGRGPWFTRYVLTFAAVGIFLPTAVVCFAPTTVATAAAPHLFLVLVQCACEGFTANTKCAALLRLAVPIGFNAYRLGTLATWATKAYSNVATVAACPLRSPQSLMISRLGFGLAALNGVMWSYNLFIFLLLRACPQYLELSEFDSPAMTWVGELFPKAPASAKVGA